MTQAPVADRSGSIYRLRVVLAGISPLIWRQVEVPDSITIAGLHEVLQVALGWSGQHLHRFIVRGKEYGICYPGGLIFDDDPHQVRLADLGLRKRERFAYAYGFFATLKSWRHDLQVQAIEAPLPGAGIHGAAAGRAPRPPKTAVAPGPSWPCARSTRCGPPPCAWPSSPRSCWTRRPTARCAGFWARPLKSCPSCCIGAGSTASTGPRSTVP